jgi:hypothetical protein
MLQAVHVAHGKQCRHISIIKLCTDLPSLYTRALQIFLSLQRPSWIKQLSQSDSESEMAAVAAATKAVTQTNKS